MDVDEKLEEAVARAQDLLARLPPGTLPVGDKVPKRIYGSGDTEILLLPPPQGVLKRTSGIKGRWEAAIYKHLQANGYPNILRSVKPSGEDRVTLALNFTVTPTMLLPTDPKNLELAGLVERRVTVANLASGLLRRLADIHQLGVLHGDVHIGNVGYLLKFASSSEAEMVPVFIDFGRAIHDGSPPPGFSRPPDHYYYPARFLLAVYESDKPVYAARDDVESLAFVILQLVFGRPSCPWGAQESEELWAETPRIIVETRERTVKSWRKVSRRSLDAVALRFTEYARRLVPGDEIEYAYWADQFQQADVVWDGYGLADWMEDWGGWVLGGIICASVLAFRVSCRSL